MRGNRLKNSAVMASRVEPHTSLDFFPTPAWATRALCEFLGRQHCEHLTAWEPACGEGHMARVLDEYFKAVVASDVHRYGHGAIADFLLPTYADDAGLDWIITNPPFRLAKQFALKAIECAKVGVALLVRTQFLESGERFNDLFSKHRPLWILQFAERVPMLRGRVEEKGTTATAYCWVIWQQPTRHDYHSRFTWIAPGTRAKLERKEDYEAAQ